jgi:phosphatidylethanolamine/phosphatidyl-N-methylethanolamine N-methyltransferase
MDAQKIARVYSFYSGFYDLIFGKMFHGSRSMAIDRLGIKPGEQILEVGAGTGLSFPFYPKNCRVVGIDLTGPMLKKGHERIRRFGLFHIHLQQMDATQLAFADDSFDAVLAAYVMTAVPNPRAVLSEMCRVCRPGGRIVILNHFTNGNLLLSSLEKSISPLCARIGFRTDLAVEELITDSPLVVQQRLKVNPLRYWQIVQCTNQKQAK